ncbi:MAG: acetyl-CoA carboxylase biotin carboxylase subunit [Terriglobales bacterium]|jgi:acetyl-CoA carboxylase biotin carboxylase subunit
MLKKILVANRGEIAVRVMRACREMGIATVAVYSDVDRAALHVRRADEAYHIGPAAASESYLSIPKIIETAKRCGADAIHPGYGFLSERAAFARACRERGVVFIGPTPESMELMGSKTRARQAMQQAGIPFVPGSAGGLATAEEALKVAASIGYPVMIKAAAGGGGKGMRLVHAAQELKSGFESASSEALRAFGDGEVYIEKFIENPRHIEIQILADQHGNCVHLGERECSVQRRHQKVVEESPSPLVDEAMRQSMGEVAVRVGKAAGYVNAGTVEFLADNQKNFFFLEMNTRLQVEHPVTELVYGLDLVQLQIRIAAGEKLPLKQGDVRPRGHAIECRVYAEDPENNFFPSPGKITRLMVPSGPGIRDDSGVYQGWTVPLDYDPMLSKLIAFGPTREQARTRLLRALDEYFVGGIRTNLALFRRILRDEKFVSGDLNTGFLDRMLSSSQPAAASTASADVRLVAAIGAALFQSNGNGSKPKNGASPTLRSTSNWKKLAREEALRGAE